MVEGKPGSREIGLAETHAIRLAETNAPTFADEHPEITEDAKTMNYAQIAEKYGVAERFGVTEAIAKSIVAGAIRRLLTPEQRAEMVTPRVIERRREMGKEFKEQGRGIFGRTQEERERDAGNAGKIGGVVSRDKGVGLFGRSEEQKIADAGNAGKVGGAVSRDKGVGLFARSAEKRVADAGKAGSIGGRVTQEQGKGIFGLSREERIRRQRAAGRADGWFGTKIEGRNEGEYTLYLATLPEYQKPADSRYAGKPDYIKITEAINKLYGKNRTPEMTRAFFGNQKRLNKTE